ncbi:hypothetical protein HDE_01622 [Halotydeus destructor]|nr:hypothetical protein HDE_01622 [Halotydeus destructor]
MVTMPSPFKSLDWFLLMNGIPLYADTVIYKCQTLFYRALFIILGLSQLYTRANKLSLHSELVLYKFSTIQFCVTLVAVHYTFLMKRISIRKLFDCVATTLDQDASARVRKACMIISAIWFIMPVLGLVCAVFIFYFVPTWKYNESMPTLSQLSWDVNVFIFVHTWFNPFYMYFSNNITAVYAAFLFGVNNGEQLFFARIQGPNKPRIGPDYKTFLIQLHKLVLCKTEFDSVMSILPMLALSYIFTGTAGYVLYMRSKAFSEYGDSFLGEVFLCLVNLAAILILVFMIEHYNCKTRSSVRIAKFYLATQDSCEHNYKFLLINELDQLAKFEYTLWSMAKLNKQSILTFSSSLITFTVLFSQLAFDSSK